LLSNHNIMHFIPKSKLFKNWPRKRYKMVNIEVNTPHFRSLKTLLLTIGMNVLSLFIQTQPLEKS